MRRGGVSRRRRVAPSPVPEARPEPIGEATPSPAGPAGPDAAIKLPPSVPLSPWLQTANDVIWAAFVLQFVLEFLVAPAKRVYLRKRWVTAVSLVLPALRLLRLVRVARAARLLRATRGLRLARVLATINRGMRGLAMTFKRRGLGYRSQRR